MRWMFPGRTNVALWSGLAVLLMTSAGSAQQSQEVRFETVDKVELKGTFYPSGGGNKSPCVLLLHKLGGNRTQDGWDDLAKALQKKGYAVLSFDFRGHNDSTTVDPSGFWSLSLNSRIFRPGKEAKDKINQADFVNSKRNYYYTPWLVNDIEAAKTFLYKRNNENECNISNLILIGADDGAALGSLWLWSQFQKPRVFLNPDTGFPIIDSTKPEGTDVAAAIWLSMPSTLARNPVGKWLANPAIVDKVPMVFFYGEKDAPAVKAAKYLYNALKSSRRLPDTTRLREEKGTKASGHELLKKTLKTSDEICSYLDKVMEKRDKDNWKKRPTSSPTVVRLLPMINLQ